MQAVEGASQSLDVFVHFEIEHSHGDKGRLIFKGILGSSLGLGGYLPSLIAFPILLAPDARKRGRW